MAEVAQKKRVVKAEHAEKIIIGLDKSNEVILQLNMDEGVFLEWDHQAFRKLPALVVEKLRPDNMKAYLVAETKAEERAKASTVKVYKNPLSPISGYSEAREFVRSRPGWHQCWANPGRDFDEKMRGPYRQVRDPTAEQKKTGYEPGEESGEVLKRLDGEGKVEAIACECPQHLFEEYLEWMSAQSGDRKQGVKADFFSAVENINRELPRDARIKPLDSEGDLQD